MATQAATPDPSVTPSAPPVIPGGNSGAPGVFNGGFDPLHWLIANPLWALAIVVIVIIGGRVLINKGWARLTMMYNAKSEPLAPLGQSLKAARGLMFKEDTTPVFTKNEKLAEKFAWLNWKTYWRLVTTALLGSTAAAIAFPGTLTLSLLGGAGLAFLIGLGHIRSIFQYRHRILMQMFEVAQSEMRYLRGAELNPWGYVQIGAWENLYYPGQTVIMYPAKYRSETQGNRDAFENHFNATVSDQHTWTYKWEPSNNRVVAEPVPYITDNAPYPFPDKHPWDEFPLGIAAGGKEAVWVVSDAPHSLVAGTTGSGKSVTQRTILLHALQSPEWRVVLVDPKRVELGEYRSHPHVLRVATELEDSVSLIEQVEQEMQSRYVRMASERVNHFRSLPTPPPAVLLMVDETFALLSPSGIKSEEGKEQDEMKARIGILLGQIARLGRAAGVHMILATQRPDAKVLPGEVKANLDARIAQGRMDTIPSSMTLDSDAATKLPSVKGRAILRTGNDFTEFQAYFLPPDQLPMVLEMAAAIAQGDTSFLEEPEVEELGPVARRGFRLPSFRMPRVQLSGSKAKWAAWVAARADLVEANNLREGRKVEDHRAVLDGRAEAKAARLTGVDALSSAVDEAARAAPLSVEEIEVMAASYSAPAGDGLFSGAPGEPASPARVTPTVEAGSADEDPYQMYPADEEDDFDFDFEAELDAQRATLASIAPATPTVAPPAQLVIASTAAPAVPAAPASVSVADVMKRATQRGVPIPASELLAALRAESVRQQAEFQRVVPAEVAPAVAMEPAPASRTVVAPPAGRAPRGARTIPAPPGSPRTAPPAVEVAPAVVSAAVAEAAPAAAVIAPAGPATPAAAVAPVVVAAPPTGPARPAVSAPVVTAPVTAPTRPVSGPKRPRGLASPAASVTAPATAPVAQPVAVAAEQPAAPTAPAATPEPVAAEPENEAPWMPKAIVAWDQGNASPFGGLPQPPSRPAR